MSFFRHAITPAVPQAKNIQVVSALAAVIIVFMALAQLFTFDEFPAVIAELWPSNDAAAQVVAVFLVTFEVFSLPFLLTLRLSPLFRKVSMVFGWLVALFWIGWALWGSFTTDGMVNGGMLGATLSLPAGALTVLFASGLGALVFWTTWGTTSLSSRRKK